MTGAPVAACAPHVYLIVDGNGRGSATPDPNRVEMALDRLHDAFGRTLNVGVQVRAKDPPLG